MRSGIACQHESFETEQRGERRIVKLEPTVGTEDRDAFAEVVDGLALDAA